ncbi:MAG: hypothetical protein KBC27_03850 [Rickettsiales bacterium]|nr:hypothetical protein [Rickettsiales bacterium]
MISIIFYGRNDSYGYNLHKRVAISLNCVAHLLTDKDDEILYVDYNTPDDHPTLPEAISDLLTEKTKKHLRIFRVRPHIHERYEKKTYLKVLEPISRNIALRRSNPNNKWILSSNTDMVFVPRNKKQSLTDIITNLPDGYYGIPRFEMPETLWESIDRKNPKEIITKFKTWGKNFHINDVVYGSKLILYDAPGDFQLATRKDLFDIHGFDEDMIIGWHVDSNLTKRMSLYGHKVTSLLTDLYGYHCDHTKQVTPPHRGKRVENCTDKYVYHVSTPYLKKQAKTWGLPEEDIEEMSLVKQRSYASVLDRILPENKQEYIESYYTAKGFDEAYYDVNHVMPYLLDLFYTIPRKNNILYIGANDNTYSLLSNGCKELGFVNKVERIDIRKDFMNRDLVMRLVNRSNSYVIDFGTEECNKKQNFKKKIYKFIPLSMENKFIKIINIITNKESKLPNHRKGLVVYVNSIGNRFFEIVKETISFSCIPYSARIRHGYVITKKRLVINAMMMLKVKMRLSVITREIYLYSCDKPKLYRILKTIYKWSGLQWMLSQ